jgi:hypothetical protein
MLKRALSTADVKPIAARPLGHSPWAGLYLHCLNRVKAYDLDMIFVSDTAMVAGGVATPLGGSYSEVCEIMRQRPG